MTYEFITLTDNSVATQRKLRNLAKLALFLKNLYEQGGWTEKFRMSVYGEGRHGSDLLPFQIKKHYNECGTCACAAGHGPLAGIKPRSRIRVNADGRITLKESWTDYISRCFITYDPGIDKWCSLQKYLFGPHHDNNPLLAAIRIAYFVLNKRFPIADYFCKEYYCAENGTTVGTIDWNELEVISKTKPTKPNEPKPKQSSVTEGEVPHCP